MQRFSIPAKKSLGQHFLVNPSTLERIAMAIQETKISNVCEIGPGKGALTKYLMQIPGINLHVIETDTRMQEPLAQLGIMNENIHWESILNTDCSTYFPGEEFMFAGNFPYNISTEILFKCIHERKQVGALTGMFQKEVAKRILAPPDNKEYGILSVLAQAYFNGQYLFDVGPGNFNPSPKVMSGVIRLTRKTTPETWNQKRLFGVVKAGFNYRRKMLRNTLTQFFPDEILSTDPFFTQRPEHLSVMDWIQLSNRSLECNPEL